MVAFLFMSWSELFSHTSVLFFVGLIFLGMIFFEYCYSYWRDLKVATLPAVIPFGHFKSFIMQKVSFEENLMELYFKLKTYGKSYAGTYMFIKPVLIVLDPELAKNILIKDFSHFTDRSTYVIDEKINPLSDHLLHMKGEKWTNLRSKISPAFTSKQLKMIFPILKLTATNLEDTLKHSEQFRNSIDIQDLMERFTINVIGSVAFGLDCYSLFEDKNNIFRRNVLRAARATSFESFIKVVSFCFPSVAKTFKLKFIPDDIKDYYINLVKDTIEERKKNNIDRKDFLQILMNLHCESKGSSSEDYNVALSTEEIAAQCFMFILAGFESSASTLTSIMYFLSINEEIQNGVRNEILEIINKDNGELTYESLKEMTYTQQVIDETLRIKPAASVVPRQCTKNYKIPGEVFTIPTGTPIMIPIRAFHNDPEIYPNPEVFDPSRFSAEEKNNRNSCAYIPFGTGPRQCIGSRFAMMQIKVGLTTLLQNYRYTLNSKTKTPIRNNPIGYINNVKGGVWVDITKIC